MKNADTRMANARPARHHWQVNSCANSAHFPAQELRTGYMVGTPVRH
jgi:hypothetical protein